MTRENMLRRLRKGDDPLEISIKKWEDIEEGKGKDDGSENCALCETSGNEDSCGDCPAYREPEGCCDGFFLIYARKPCALYARAVRLFLEGLRT